MAKWVFRALMLGMVLMATLPAQAADPKIKQVSGESCPPGGCATSAAPTAYASSGGCASCAGGEASTGSRFGHRFKSHCECSNSCDAPLHCSSAACEAKFIFGGCKSFFSNRCAPPHGYSAPPTSACEYGTFHRY